MAFRAFWRAFELDPFTYRPLSGSEIRRLVSLRPLPRGYRFVLLGEGRVELRIVRPVGIDEWEDIRTGERYESLKVEGRPFRPRLYDPETGRELPRLRLLMPLHLPTATVKAWLEPFRRLPPPEGLELVEVTPFAYELNPKDRIDPETGLSRRPPRFRACFLTPLRRFTTKEELEELLRQVGAILDKYPMNSVSLIRTTGIRGLRVRVPWLLKWTFPDRPTTFYDAFNNIFYATTSQLVPQGGFTPPEASSSAFIVAGMLGYILKDKFMVSRPYTTFDAVPERDKPYIIEELIKLGRMTEEEGRRLLS